jgi:hypothetical protein
MTLLYWWVLLLGGLGVALAMADARDQPVVVGLALTALYLTLVYPVGLRHDEARHFVPAYPFVLILASLATERLLVAGRSALARVRLA